MRFSLLDEMQCSCGCRELQVDGVVTGEAALQPDDEAACGQYCGFVRRPRSEVKPEDCLRCRRLEVLQGVIRCDCGRNWQIVGGIPGFSRDLLSGGNGSGPRVIETDPAADPRWERFVTRHANGTIYHHPLWLQALEVEYSRRRINLACEGPNGRLLAILPLFYTRGLPFGTRGQITGRRLASLPRTPLGGPLSIDQDATVALLKTAVELARREPGVQIQLKTQSMEFDGLAPDLACTPWRHSYVLDLSGDPERPQCSNSLQRHRVKWAVNKAIKLGLAVREAETESELRAWYPLYLDTMRRNVVPPRPYRFFAALWKLLRPAGLMRLVLADRVEGGQSRTVAGSILVSYAHTASYIFTGSKKQDLLLHPNDLIQWHAIHEAARRGLHWYDFGEVPEDHQQLTLFKSKWGAEPIQLYRYYYPRPLVTAAPAPTRTGLLRSLAAAGWKHLPLSATAALGERIYSYL